MRDFSLLRFTNKSAMARDYLASLSRKPMRQRDLIASLTMDQDFLGKVNHDRHIFFVSIAQWGNNIG